MREAPSAGRRTALVTGASRGLGGAISAALARDGAHVAINYRRDRTAAETLRAQITEAGGRAELFRADITDETAVEELYDRIVAEFGSLDILVLNATGPQPDLPVEELRWRDVLDQLEFFVKSPLLLVRRAVPGMRERGFGRIVQIGSDVVALGPARSSAYVAAKSAQLGLTRSWARELGPHGITVNTVAPGWIPTDRHDGIGPDARDAYAASVPLGHFGARRVPVRHPHADVVQARGEIGRVGRQVLEVVPHVSRDRLDQLDLEVADPAQRNLHPARRPAVGRGVDIHVGIEMDPIGDAVPLRDQRFGPCEVARDIGVLEEIVQMHARQRAAVVAHQRPFHSSAIGPNA